MCNESKKNLGVETLAHLMRNRSKAHREALKNLSKRRPGGLLLEKLWKYYPREALENFFPRRTGELFSKKNWRTSLREALEGFSQKCYGGLLPREVL